MINPRWLELPMSRIIFHGPKDVRGTDIMIHGGITILIDDQIDLSFELLIIIYMCK